MLGKNCEISDKEFFRQPIEINAAKLREGSWKLWEWLSDETPIEFIDEILIEVLPLIVGDIIILHRKEVGL